MNEAERQIADHFARRLGHQRQRRMASRSLDSIEPGRAVKGRALRMRGDIGFDPLGQRSLAKAGLPHDQRRV